MSVAHTSPVTRVCTSPVGGAALLPRWVVFHGSGLGAGVHFYREMKISLALPRKLSNKVAKTHRGCGVRESCSLCSRDKIASLKGPSSCCVFPPPWSNL